MICQKHYISHLSGIPLIIHTMMLHLFDLPRFKEGLTGGEWLDHTDSVLTNKIGTVMGE